MKRNHLTALLAAGLLMAPAALMAGDDKPKQPRPGASQRDRVDQIAKRLKLSAEQRKQWNEVVRVQGVKMRALHQKRDLAREQRAKQLAELRKETNAKLSQILNKEQQAEYRQILARRQPQPQPGNAGGARHSAIGYLRQLDLTPDQQTKVREIFAPHREAFQGVRELPQQQRAAKQRELMAKLEKPIVALLTEAQRKKLAALRKQPPANAPRPNPDAGGRQNPLAKLELSPEQATAIREVQQEQQTAYAKLRELPVDERRAKYREVYEANQKKIREILTDAQFKKLQELRRQGQRPRQSDRKPKQDA